MKKSAIKSFLSMEHIYLYHYLGLELEYMTIITQW